MSGAWDEPRTVDQETCDHNWLANRSGVTPVDEVCIRCGLRREIPNVQPEELAQFFHETYEKLAPDFGYKTREASAVAWDDVPIKNKLLMVATCAQVLDRLGIKPEHVR